MTEPQREQREWWVVAEGRVVRAVGYSCAPQNPDVWWFPHPSVGFSGTVGFSVFADREDAIAKCRTELRAEINRLEKLLAVAEAGADPTKEQP